MNTFKIYIFRINSLDPLNILNSKIEIQWVSEVWYKGTVKGYNTETQKYTVQYDDDGELFSFDPLVGRPNKEKKETICKINDEMTVEEQAQNVSVHRVYGKHCSYRRSDFY